MHNVMVGYVYWTGLVGCALRSRSGDERRSGQAGTAGSGIDSPLEWCSTVCDSRQQQEKARSVFICGQGGEV